MTVIGAGHVARMGHRNFYEILVGKPEGKHRLGDLGVDKKTVLKLMILNKQHLMTWTGFI
jgi:hypothetical protein